MADILGRLQDAIGEQYRIERQIASGGMALVFLAHDLRHGRPVAVKVIRPRLAEALGTERFTREVRVTATLSHRNIPPLLDSGEADGLLYFLMPYFEGPTLAEHLRQHGPWGVEETLELGLELADALDYAHRAGVVHRDVKPTNVFLEEGHALLGDFGIALAGADVEADRITSDETMLGTVEYMSPEQCSGSHDVGPCTDIYSLGCVLFEMLTGEPPFVGRTPLAVVARHLSETPPPASGLRGDLSPEIDAIVSRCLAKVPRDRFGSAAELREALDRALRHTRSGEVVLPARPLARRALPWAVGGLALAGAVAVALQMSAPTGAAEAPDPYKVIGFPLADRGGGADMGADAGVAIGNVLNHAEPLRWRDGWSYLDTEQRSDPNLLTTAQARAIALERRAGHFITGGVSRAGESTIVRLVLYDTQGDSVVNEASAEGVEGRLRTDQVAVRAAIDLLPSLLDPGRTVDLSFITDRDPAAIALWIQGDRAYRRARFDEALDLYQRAVDRDSLLIYAALKGGRAASWSERVELGDALVAQAIRHDSVLPPRYRAYAEALRSYSAGDADPAVAHFRTALAEDPEWAEAWAGLGEVYRHLLPSDIDVHRSAQEAFEHAVELDPEFIPPLIHRAEGAFRAGDAALGRELLARIDKVQPPHGTAVDALPLIATCVDPRAPEGDGVPTAYSVALLYASHQLAAAGWRPDCAEAGFRTVLERTDATRDERFDALQGLEGVLLAQGRGAELGTALDQAAAGGEGSVPFLTLFGALVSPELAARARAVDARAEAAWGPDYTVLDPLTTWILAVWNAFEGDLAALESLDRHATKLAADQDDARTRLVAEAVGAHRRLAEGDSAGALQAFDALRPVGTRQQLDNGFVEPLAVERLRLAELLLARGRLERAWEVASIFDHSQPYMFAVLVPRSLEIRFEAARGLRGRMWEARAEEARARLEGLGWPDPNLVGTGDLESRRVP